MMMFPTFRETFLRNINDGAWFITVRIGFGIGNNRIQYRSEYEFLNELQYSTSIFILSNRRVIPFLVKIC